MSYNKKIARDVILVLITLGGIISFFYKPETQGIEYLRTLMGAIVGYYIGMEEIPVFSAVRAKRLS